MKVLMVILVLAFIVLTVSTLNAATISGRVVTDGGIPVQGVLIRQFGGCTKLRKAGVEVFTDANGEYVLNFPDLPCYATFVRPEHPDFYYAYPNAAIFLLFPHGEADFLLTNSGANSQ